MQKHFLLRFDRGGAATHGFFHPTAQNFRPFPTPEQLKNYRMEKMGMPQNFSF